jgi:hypothetical protein
MEGEMRLLLIASIMLGGVAMASAADMTGEELTALLQNGKKITLGGKGMGYKGSLAVKADGTASGSAKPDNGDAIQLSGTWRIKGDKFCRKWKAVDGGKEVCETWRKEGNRKAAVFAGGKQIGMNSW